MTPTLVALAGASRSGKGTCASVFAEKAGALGLTTRERQLSGPGKQYVASAFRPDISEEQAIVWFEELKKEHHRVDVVVQTSGSTTRWPKDHADASLQQYLQRMLQGARDRWGADFWTDKLLPFGFMDLGRAGELDRKLFGRDPVPNWYRTFFPDVPAAAVAIISDLRQVSEAKRVKELGGIVIELYRPETDDAYITGKDHITEQRLSDLAPDLVDVTIVNRGSLDDLKGTCSMCFEHDIRPRLETP